MFSIYLEPLKIITTKLSCSTIVKWIYKCKGEIVPWLKGVGVWKIDIFKELTPRSRTYQLRGQRKKRNVQNHDKKTPHTILQKLSRKTTHLPLKG